MERVEGMTAFISGGARGIGLGIARAFARAGVKLAIADLDPDSLEAANSELARLTAVETFNLDVRDREAYARVADEVEARLGPVSILCNNAGVAGPTRPSYEFWDWMLGINLNGVINGIQTFLPRMIERGAVGHIVNTASAAGLVGGEQRRYVRHFEIRSGRPFRILARGTRAPANRRKRFMPRSS